jgi:hypothetical protein
MHNPVRFVTRFAPLGAALLLVAGCATGSGFSQAGDGRVQIAGPLDSIARAPRMRAARGCDFPALDNALVASQLMNATMGGPPVAATVCECHRSASLR